MNRTSNPPRKNSNALRRVEYVGADSSNGSYDKNTDRRVHTIGAIGESPFVIKGRINNNRFTAMIDSGSPLIIFAAKDLKDIFRTDVFSLRLLPQSENMCILTSNCCKSPDLSFCN